MLPSPDTERMPQGNPGELYGICEKQCYALNSTPEANEPRQHSPVTMVPEFIVPYRNKDSNPTVLLHTPGCMLGNQRRMSGVLYHGLS